MPKQLVKRSFQRLKPSRIVRPFETREEIILRDYLAMQRTTLANERTLFAYLRTTLYLILGGIGLLEVETFSNLQWAGYLAFGVSVFLLIYGFTRYLVLRNKLKKFYNAIGIEEQLTEDKRPESEG